MPGYVSFCIGNDKILGRTIYSETLIDAVFCCIHLALDNKDDPTPEFVDSVSNNGSYKVSSGNIYYIGQLEGIL